MSTRWYPLYQKGNPQLRVFLPNFWMKLIKSKTPQPPNVVVFKCSMEMTVADVKNYLEKIYKVSTVQVRTRIHQGIAKKNIGQPYVVKEDDVKIAYAVLPKDQIFTFPHLANDEQKAKEEKEEKDSLKEMKKAHTNFLKANNKPGVPGWFSI